METKADKVKALLKRIYVHQDEICHLNQDIEKIQNDCNHPREKLQKDDEKISEKEFTFPVLCNECLKMLRLEKSQRCMVCLGDMEKVDENHYHADSVVERFYRCSQCSAEYKELERI